eukprot:CAMPEP_0197243990 /NCGR_PEP_ID=MMETSP1429-20130617/9253_1 /TAXON_ID=49237 /ORGANISM="Chaetoceros  sp., Strain UNC1202" /LENGTH=162 /DNA_ID=CAMNT_0042704285 /DNA_START=12 /DNA_END=500 /DNA_ORIENTATION=+
MAELIRDLDITKAYDSATSSSFSKDDLDSVKHSRYNINTKITPLQEIQRVKHKCDAYLRRVNHFRKEIEAKTESNAGKESINQSIVQAKIFDLNYGYCLAHVSCPQRTAVLNECFHRHPPEVVQALAQAGQHEFICMKERKAVERCCGQKVESIMRQVLEER